ncbi:unnamed protein product [Ectocarpus sp. CCAP 1310/34]|nr:unnamed protein product [Ectocarpus sp. CCAP 1310/34]
MLVAHALRAEAKSRKMARGTAGLAEGNHPHVLDAADLLKTSWDSITPTTIARCFVKAKTLPEDMEAELTAAHGKHRPSGSAAPAGGPVLGRADKESVDLLAKTLTSMSSRVHEAQEKSYGVDTELTEMLAALGITAGEPADAAAVRAAEVWATVEDQPDVVEAVQQDAVDEMTELLHGTAPAEESSDDEASEEP